MHLIPEKEIGWRSARGSIVSLEGHVRFEPTPAGATRVIVRLSYSPPLGAAGHAVATLFGADPKHQLDDDLLRMKTLVEEGVVPHDAQPTAGGEASAPPDYLPPNT